MAHEVETMAYSGQVPWHGLGQPIHANATVEEMLVAAGLDWEVSLRPIYAQAKDGSMVKMPIKRALMRSSDNKIFTVTGDFWKPFQNREALEFFRDYTESGGARLETAGSLRGGRIIWALASINAGFTLRHGDTTKGYILLTSPHEVGKRITVHTTSVRVVCANTMRMATNESEPQYGQSHVRKFDVIAAKETIGLAREQMNQAHLDAQALDQLKMSPYDTVRFLAQFFQPMPEGVKEEAFVNGLMNAPNTQDKKLAMVLASTEKAPGATPGTAWGVLNGITHWADHVAGAQPEARLFNAWLGERSKLKLKVRDALLEMV